MRPSIDERINKWLNEEADRYGIPDTDRQRFIDHLRNTTLAARVRLNLAVRDLWEDSRIPHWLERLIKTTARILTPKENR